MVQLEIAERLRAASGNRTYGAPTRDRPARLRGRTGAQGRPRRVQAAPAGRLGDPAPAPHRSGRRRGDPRPRPRRLRPPPQNPGAVAGDRRAAGRPEAASGRPRRAGGARAARGRACRAPRAGPIRRALRDPPRDARPRPRQAEPRPLPRPRRARTACTNSARCSSRWRWRTCCGSRRPSATRSICPGVEGENLAARALAALRERGLGRAAAADRDREAHPGRGGPRRRLRRRRRGPPPRRPRRAFAVGPYRSRQCERMLGRGGRPAGDRRGTGGRRSLAAPAGARAGPGRGGEGRAAARRPPSTRWCCCRAVAGSRPRRSSTRPTGSASVARRPSSTRSPPRCAPPPGRAPRRSSYVDLLVNDLEPAAAVSPPRHRRRAWMPSARTGAPAVFLSGSGPTAVGLFPSLAEAEAAASSLDRDDTIVCLA